MKPYDQDDEKPTVVRLRDDDRYWTMSELHDNVRPGMSRRALASAAVLGLLVIGSILVLVALGWLLVTVL